MSAREQSRFVRPIRTSAREDDALIERLAHSRLVLIGEASHGTHEFYRERAEITMRLVAERGFRAVAVETDWPDAYRVNRWVRGSTEDRDAEAALSGFERFPNWMWRNADVLDFVGWLRAHNEGAGRDAPVGFYGLDLYSLNASIDAVLAYLAKVDPEAERRARARYACFDHFAEDTSSYGYAAHFGLTPSCEDEVVRQLVELRREAAVYASRDGRVARDEYFFAEQNARLIHNAERYYRTMFGGSASSWNLRDSHMVEILFALERFLESEGVEPKIVVWAHNSHLGDARATQMGREGEWNVGQLVRERRPEGAVLVGLTTYEGTVTAAADWGAPAEHMRVRPGRFDAYEALLHGFDVPRFWIDLKGGAEMERALQGPRLERAIGVVYRPETERMSHYFDARLPRQFDVVLHYDRTRAVEPLDRNPEWLPEEVPETYPSAL